MNFLYHENKIKYKCFSKNIVVEVVVEKGFCVLEILGNYQKCPTAYLSNSKKLLFL